MLLQNVTKDHCITLLCRENPTTSFPRTVYFAEAPSTSAPQTVLVAETPFITSTTIPSTVLMAETTPTPLVPNNVLVTEPRFRQRPTVRDIFRQCILNS